MSDTPAYEHFKPTPKKWADELKNSNRAYVSVGFDTDLPPLIDLIRAEVAEACGPEAEVSVYVSSSATLRVEVRP